MAANSNYFRVGVKKGFKAGKNFSFFEKFLFVCYLFASIPFRFIFLIAPVIAVADVNIGRIIDNDEPLSLGRIFSNCVRRNRYLELMVFYLIRSMVLLGVLAFINLPTIFIFTFAPATMNYESIIPFGIAIAIIMGIISLLAYLFATLYFAPAAYVSSRGEKGYFSDIVHNSYNGVKDNAGTLFGIYFKYFMFFLAIALPTLGLSILLFCTAGIAGAVFGTLFLIAFLILSFFFIPNIYFSFQTSKYMFYDACVSKQHSYVVKNKDGDNFDVEEEEEEEESEDEDELEEEKDK